jgi:hypothetical protein
VVDQYLLGVEVVGNNMEKYDWSLVIVELGWSIMGGRGGGGGTLLADVSAFFSSVALFSAFFSNRRARLARISSVSSGFSHLGVDYRYN